MKYGMQLILRRTLEEILEHNRRATGAPDLLRILNVVSPRSWRFVYSFDSSQKINLQISSDPALSQDEFAIIADGSIPELFNSRSISFFSRRTAVGGEIEYERNNKIELRRISSDEFEGIRLNDFMHGPLPAPFSDHSVIAEYLASRTWFGSHFISKLHQQKTCEWTVFASKFIGQPRSWADQPSDEQTFQRELEVKIRNCSAHLVIVGTAPSAGDFSSRHSRLGPFTVNDEFPQIVKKALGICCLSIEANEKDLRYESNGDIGPFETLSVMNEAILASVIEVLGTKAFADFALEIDIEKNKRAAQLLRDRQENAQQRPRLFIGDRMFGYEPRSENEVMMLLAKLEAMGALPISLFRLVEYTPKLGIDALADIRIDDTGMTMPLAPIELELNFENFISHGHPIQQVAMIVCWTFRSPMTITRLNLEKINSWLYQYTTEYGSCYVLILSEIPNLIQNM